MVMQLSFACYVHVLQHRYYTVDVKPYLRMRYMKSDYFQ
jgi:hypothetical protein